MDWRDVLRERGVPVWVGARVQCGADRASWGTVVDTGDNVVTVRHWATRSEVEAEKHDCLLFLDDPDTQPAYLRRLAVRLGCPEEVVQEGVRFYQVMRGLWILDAGFVHLSFRAQWSHGFERLGTNNRLLALALAWPKEGV